ncbi:MAG: hypothetical protein HKN80_07635 [Acidimicrobiia bacterium]|nr:hypothetical protein [Acidimicrobiia bacterium]
MADPKKRDIWRHSSKEKMGPEFSGLEGPRDFLVGILFLVLLIVVAMVIAFVMFG